MGRGRGTGEGERGGDRRREMGEGKGEGTGEEKWGSTGGGKRTTKGILTVSKAKGMVYLYWKYIA